MRIRMFHLPVMLPRSQSPRGPWINVMPIGLLALADHLAQNGHEVEVVHGGVEARLQPSFSVLYDLQHNHVDLIAFALHWQHQIGPVAETVKQLHLEMPDTPVVLGGLTATAFAPEILKDWPGVDFILTGEAERGFAELAQSLSNKNQALESISNLAYRDRNSVRINSRRYVASQEDLDALNFSRFDLLRHRQSYNAQFGASSSGNWSNPPVFYVASGRGCSMDCAFCSGGRTGQKSLAFRKKVLFRKPERVVDDIQQAMSFGMRTIYFCFDPPQRSEAYYLKLFALLEQLGHNLACVFECYRPPSDEFLKSMIRVFAKGRRRLSFSPTVADPKLRTMLLGPGFDSQQLEHTLQRCSELDIDTTLYFAAVPQESTAQFEESLYWQQRLSDCYGSQLIYSPIEIEPHAPWERNPETFGLQNARRGWKAYRRRHGPETTLGVNYADEIGYAFPEVDARLVRAASALLNPAGEMAAALSLCGLGNQGHYAIAAPGRLDQLLMLLKIWRGRSYTLIVHDQQDQADRQEWYEMLAAVLGPHLRVIRMKPDTVRHLRWNGRTLGSIPQSHRLLVLHLKDAQAVNRLFSDHTRILTGFGHAAVLAESCRWTNQACPATQPGIIALGHDGAMRCCPSSKDLRSDSLEEFKYSLTVLREEAERRRGCSVCPARNVCSRCIFPGAVGEQEFCQIRRQWAAEDFNPLAGLETTSSHRKRIAIGWDD